MTYWDSQQNRASLGFHKEAGQAMADCQINVERYGWCRQGEAHPLRAEGDTVTFKITLLPPPGAPWELVATETAEWHPGNTWYLDLHASTACE